MAVIFAFSHHANIETGLSFDFTIKKLAHILEYGILAIAFYLALAPKPGLWSLPAARLTWLLCLLFALSDETHQHFIPSRTAHPRDVLIDAVGSLLGLLILRHLLLRREPQNKKAASS